MKILEVRIEEASGCNKESVPTWGPEITEGFVRGAIVYVQASLSQLLNSQWTCSLGR